MSVCFQAYEREIKILEMLREILYWYNMNKLLRLKVLSRFPYKLQY